MKITSFSKERCYFLCSDVIQLLWSLDRLTPDKYDDYQKASSNCACFEVTSNFQHKLPTICAVNCFPYVNVAMTKCNQNVDTNEHGFSRLMFTYHITPEATLSALKSAIAENGMGVTSRP